MKIAFYTQQEITPLTGGIGRVTSILANYFRKHYGWQVYSLYAETVPQDYDQAEVDGALQARLHDRLGVRHGINNNSVRAAEFLKRNEVDIIIVQTCIDVAARLREAMAQVSFNIPIITCLHFSPGKDVFLSKLSDLRKVNGINEKSMKTIVRALLSPIYNPLILRRTKKLYRSAYHYSDYVCLLAEPYKKEFCDYGNIKEQVKLMAMPNPLSFEIDVEPTVMQQKQNTVLVIGRIEEIPKHISLIIDLWAHYEHELPESDWQLKIVGNGPSLLDYQQRAVTLGVRRCSFEGLQNPQSYYREAKLFLMTSDFEGFPMTLVEAQQYGCVPIVLHTFSALSEIVEHGRNGMIVEGHDMDAFYQTMLRLMSNTEATQKMGLNAMHDCQRYSQRNVCDKWKGILERMIKKT